MSALCYGVFAAAFMVAAFALRRAVQTMIARADAIDRADELDLAPFLILTPGEVRDRVQANSLALLETDHG